MHIIFAEQYNKTMNKTLKPVLSAIALILSFGLGFLCANIQFNKENGQGDILKISRRGRAEALAQATPMEILINNPEEFQKTQTSLVKLNSRLKDFDNLVVLAVKSGKDIDALYPMISKVKELSRQSAEAKSNAQEALDALNRISMGERLSSDEFSRVMRNISVAYLMVDRQVSACKEYVATLDKFLKGKDPVVYSELITSRNVWASYLQ